MHVIDPWLLLTQLELYDFGVLAVEKEKYIEHIDLDNRVYKDTLVDVQNDYNFTIVGNHEALCILFIFNHASLCICFILLCLFILLLFVFGLDETARI